MKELIEMQNEAHEACLDDLADLRRHRIVVEAETRKTTEKQETMVAETKKEFASSRMHRSVITFISAIQTIMLAIFLMVYIYRG